MAKKYEPPPTHEAGDSDEDCEVYFLKPVNEYNITERIKEANKELFADGSSTVNVEAYEDDNDDSGNTLEATLASNRKVTFALNLEDYEPVNGSEGGGGGGGGGGGSASGSSGELTPETEASELHTKLTRDFKFPPIEEEEIEGENHNDDANLKHSLDGKQLRMANDDDYDEAGTVTALRMVVSNDVDDEICEEIIIMDMEEQTPKRKSTNNITMNERTASIQQRRHIMKQNTFAYEDEDDDILDAQQQQQQEEEIEEIAELAPCLLVTELTDESDNKSLTNLLISDCEDDGDSKNFANNDEGGDVNDADIIDEDDIDDDEDDKLSIIVASYISDDYGCDDDDEYGDETTSLHANGAKQSQKNGARKTTKSRRILPFTKRFSLRRKVNSSSSNAIGISAGRCNSANSKRQQQQSSSLPQITDLKLNYKTCCEYRQAGQEKLPKYTGYLSEYGLSAAQLAQRAERKQRKQRHLLEQTLKANEQEMRKMHDNERAFTTWLRNKMRYPINKTRNMFDIKKTNNIFGSNCTVKSSGLSFGHMRQRNAAAHAGGGNDDIRSVSAGNRSAGGDGDGKQQKKK